MKQVFALMWIWIVFEYKPAANTVGLPEERDFHIWSLYPSWNQGAHHWADEEGMALKLYHRVLQAGWLPVQLQATDSQNYCCKPTWLLYCFCLLLLLLLVCNWQLTCKPCIGVISAIMRVSSGSCFWNIASCIEWHAMLERTPRSLENLKTVATDLYRPCTQSLKQFFCVVSSWSGPMRNCWTLLFQGSLWQRQQSLPSMIQL